MTGQSFEKHSRYVPSYHFVALPILIINVVWTAYVMSMQGVSKTGIWSVVVAIALVLVAWHTRAMPVAAQDRVIRLEERMRLRERLPEALRARANELTPRQLIGLRFASDEELPELAERCLKGEFQNSKDLKRAIKTWRPDNLRV